MKDHKLPKTVEELVKHWAGLAKQLNGKNDQEIAYMIVGQLAGNDELWRRYYENDDPDEYIQLIFDNAADLEMPNGITIADDEHRSKAWDEIKSALKVLEKKYL